MKPSISLQTPLGIGVFQGFMPTLQNGIKVNKLLVRLPINATTEPHKRDANCLTKKAVINGLWLFSADEVKAAQS